MHPGIRSHSGMHFPFERQLGKLVPFFSRIPGFPLHVVRGNPIPLFCVILGYNFPLLRRLYGDNSLQSLLDEWPCATWPRGKSATLVQHASVAQGIEHRSPKAGVDGSNPPGGTREYDGVAGAAPFLVQDFSPLAAQRPALNHPLRGWRQTALQSHPSDRY